MRWGLICFHWFVSNTLRKSHIVLEILFFCVKMVGNFNRTSRYSYHIIDQPGTPAKNYLTRSKYFWFKYKVYSWSFLELIFTILIVIMEIHLKKKYLYFIISPVIKNIFFVVHLTSLLSEHH